MANIVFQNSIDGLFDILNQIFSLQTQVDATTSDRRLSWDNIRTIYGSEFTDATWTAIVSETESSIAREESSPSAAVLALKALAEQTVIQKVDAAVNLTSKTLDAALVEMASQMAEQAKTLLLPAVTITVAANGANTGDLVMVASRKTVGGRDNAQLLAEVIDIAALASPGSVVLSITSDAVSDGLSPNGFGGSGINAFLNYYTTSSGLTGNSGLYSFTANSSSLPGNWIANVGTLGTAVLSGQPQVSTIVVTGTPTSGTFRVTCATSSLGTQSTGNLSFDSTAAQIQAAVSAMTGFSRVSISATGTGPNYTHTLTFFGMREAVTVAVVNSTNSGTFTVATPTAFATPSFGSSPIVLVSDGTALVSVTHALTHLLPNTAYAVNAWLALNTSAASGVIEFSLTNGVGGTIIQDDAGVDLRYTVNATSLTTTPKGSAGVVASGAPIWMTPKVMPASAYLRIRCSTTLPSTRQVYIENVVIAPATQVYVGGPFVGLFAGPVGPKAGDLWTVTTTNDRAGKTSLSMERNFNMRERGLTIPHSASPNITDMTPAAAGPGTCWYEWDVAFTTWELMNDSCAVGYSPSPPGSSGTVDGEGRAGTCT